MHQILAEGLVVFCKVGASKVKLFYISPEQLLPNVERGKTQVYQLITLYRHLNKKGRWFFLLLFDIYFLYPVPAT